jgi:antitoxin (DNA-binding transcriptional repressor) of toxin-antitoxin stability system
MKAVKPERKAAQKGPKGSRKSRVALTTKLAHTISATQAARTFSDLLNRVRYRGEGFVIERGGEAVCQMSPIKPLRFNGSDFLRLLRSLPKPDAGFWNAVEEATY